MLHLTNACKVLLTMIFLHQVYLPEPIDVTNEEKDWIMDCLKLKVPIINKVVDLIEFVLQQYGCSIVVEMT